jgi:Pentapeptide repeats (8 copies)
MQICRIPLLIMLPFCPLGQNSLAADFSDSNLTGAHLTNADLRGSNLSGADLTGADLSGTDLTGASVTQRQLDGACGSDTKLPAGLTITSCAASTVQAPPPEAHNEDGTSTGISIEIPTMEIEALFSQQPPGRPNVSPNAAIEASTKVGR